jgi:hypothetical protein
MSTPIQTVENAIAAKLREIQGLTVYEVRPTRGFPLPAATLQLIYTRIRGGFPDKMQYLDVSFQVDVWSRTESQMRELADKVLRKLYEARTSLGFVDIVPWGGRDLPEENVWRRSFDFRVTTTIAKS